MSFIEAQEIIESISIDMSGHEKLVASLAKIDDTDADGCFLKEFLTKELDYSREICYENKFSLMQIFVLTNAESEFIPNSIPDTFFQGVRETTRLFTTSTAMHLADQAFIKYLEDFKQEKECINHAVSFAQGLIETETFELLETLQYIDDMEWAVFLASSDDPFGIPTMVPPEDKYNPFAGNEALEVVEDRYNPFLDDVATSSTTTWAPPLIL
jgi:hypothetical protein